MSNLRVLVVDDTVTYRRILTDVVNSLAGAEAVATANNGKIALAKMRQDRPDLVLLDLVMPEMDGLETLSRIREEFPDVGVIMISGSSKSQAVDTVKALELGAMDFIAKPEERDPGKSFNQLKNDLRPLLTLFITRRHVKGITLKPKEQSRKTEVPRGENPCHVSVLPNRAFHSDSLVLIGVSTGGPNALGEVIPRLPANFKLPILIVQHMPPSFTASLAEHLNKKSSIVVKEAQDGDLVIPGRALIAPGGRHMVVRYKAGDNSNMPGIVVGLNDLPPVNSCRPAVDVLFGSVAECNIQRTLAVIMTGMGEDGMAGVRSLKGKGCYCLAQSEDSCVVYGMPRAVVEAGLADEVMPLDRIAERIIRIVGS
ncbi:MAG: chemotaxis response regulator protein-glutamate methylesterase [Pseudomonadota bacterium]